MKEKTYLLTFKRIHQTIFHDIPQLWVSDFGCDNQMLLIYRNFQTADHTGACHSHASYLRWQGYG